MCGEKLRSNTRHPVPRGSPPRVRGKAGGQSSALNAPGITPACAGKSAFPLRSVRSCKDHPRVCGEKKAAVTTLFWTGGSPPRVRGKDRDIARSRHAVGITPACAGKSRRRKCPNKWAKDHPRVCGEKTHTFMHLSTELGSPPRVRGKGGGRQRPTGRGRITPACAGKRKPSAHRRREKRDHPRVCGEKTHTFMHLSTELGSPPRVRGKGGGRQRPTGRGRITPACAGKRKPSAHRRREKRDHPRVCGEKYLASDARNSAMGSPPRVRGKD